MSAVSEFAKTVAKIGYSDLPANVVAATKKQLLDTLAAIVAGSMSRDLKQLVELIKDWGGKEESTILGYGGKVPCVNAALINGFSAVILDFDDFHDLDFIHSARAIVPASLAMAERKGAVSGKDFITAVALGFDLACRMGRAALVGRDSGFMTSPNYFGAAASCGKLLGLGEVKIKNALGIALPQVGGLGPGIEEALNIKGITGGLEARAGVLSALMAERGFTGNSDPIEHNKMGFFAVFLKGFYNPAMLTEDLGKDFAGATVSQKPYPSCRFTHIPIQAALALVTEHDIKPENVAEIIVHHGPIAQLTCEPLAEKRQPRNTIHTQHSIPWSVANAVVYRKVGIEHHTEEAIHDKKVLEMAQKVSHKLHPEFAHMPVTEPALVEIKTTDGKIFSKRVDVAPGSPQAPMSYDDVAKKFQYCCGFADKPISRKNQDKAIQMIKHLENVDDIGQIARLLG